MTTYTITGSFGWAGGGKSGAVVDAWAASRFTGPPAENSAPPSGDPDAGPVTTSETFGNPGAFYITGITVLQDYWVRVQYGEQTFWGFKAAGSLGGLGGGSGDVLSVFGRTGFVVAQTGDYTATQVGADPAGAAATAQSNAETYAAVLAVEAQAAAQAAGLPRNGSGTMSGPLLMGGNIIIGAEALQVGGVTGATAVTGYVGGTTSGAPVSGTFTTGNWIVAQNGVIWICTAGGTPGTWVPNTATTLGVLGYAEITTSQTGITSLVNITGLTVTVSVGSGRMIKITAFTSEISGGAGAADEYAMYIVEGTTVLNAAAVVSNSFAQATAILSPSVGSHTYFVQATHSSGSTSGTFSVSATQPAYILVEDIGT